MPKRLTVGIVPALTVALKFPESVKVKLGVCDCVAVNEEEGLSPIMRKGVAETGVPKVVRVGVGVEDGVKVEEKDGVPVPLRV